MKDPDPPLRVKLLVKAMLFMLIIPISTFTSISASPVVPETNRLIILNGNSVMALTSPGSDSLTGITLLDKIIKAESSNRWWIKNPHSTAYGYCQITKDTRIDAEKALGEINWKDPKQQIKACVWLYKTRGTRPWNDSRDKWDK